MKFLHSAYIACNLENNISQCHRRSYLLVVVQPFVLPIILQSDDTSGNKFKNRTRLNVGVLIMNQCIFRQ